MHLYCHNVNLLFCQILPFSLVHNPLKLHLLYLLHHLHPFQSLILQFLMNLMLFLHLHLILYIISLMFHLLYLYYIPQVLQAFLVPFLGSEICLLHQVALALQPSNVKLELCLLQNMDFLLLLLLKLLFHFLQMVIMHLVEVY